MGPHLSSSHHQRLLPALALLSALTTAWSAPSARGQFTGGLLAFSLRLEESARRPSAVLPSFPAPPTLAPPIVAVTRRLDGPDFAASTLRRPFLFLPLVQVGLAAEPTARPAPHLPLLPTPARRPGAPGFALPPEPAAFAYVFPSGPREPSRRPEGIRLVDRYAGHTVTFTGGTMSLPRTVGLSLGSVRPVRGTGPR